MSSSSTSCLSTVLLGEHQQNYSHAHKHTYAHNHKRGPKAEDRQEQPTERPDRTPMSVTVLVQVILTCGFSKTTLHFLREVASRGRRFEVCSAVYRIPLGISRCLSCRPLCSCSRVGTTSPNFLSLPVVVSVSLSLVFSLPLLLSSSRSLLSRGLPVLLGLTFSISRTHGPCSAAPVEWSALFASTSTYDKASTICWDARLARVGGRKPRLSTPRWSSPKTRPRWKGTRWLKSWPRVRRRLLRG